MFAYLHRCAILLAALPLLTLQQLAYAADAPETKMTADIPYREGADLTHYEKERCKLDLYAPAGEASKGLPCVVWFHGGALEHGSKDGDAEGPVASAMARDGMVVAVVNYRLSPQVKYPAYIDDAAAAVAWMKAHTAEYGGDPARVFVAGHSAGGYLAAMVGLDPQYLAKYGLKLSDIAGLIPISGQAITHSTVRAERGIPRSRVVVDEAAPLYHATRASAPWLILYASTDMAMRGEECNFLAAALRSAGHKRVKVEKIPGRDHVSVGNNIANDGDVVRQKISEFVKSVTASSAVVDGQ